MATAAVAAAKIILLPPLAGVSLITHKAGVDIELTFSSIVADDVVCTRNQHNLKVGMILMQCSFSCQLTNSSTLYRRNTATFLNGII